MSLFSFFSNLLAKAKASIIVENLLIIQNERFNFDDNISKTSQELINQVFESMPDVYEGKFGVRPHKITIAIAALAEGLNKINVENKLFTPYLLSLATALNEVEINSGFYSFTNIDYTLINTSVKILEQKEREFELKNKDILDNFDFLSKNLNSKKESKENKLQQMRKASNLNLK